MKKIISLFIILLINLLTYAQSNNGFNYKALLTDNGEALVNTSINVKATFYNAADEIKWQEEHTGIITDENGIFTIALGEGTRLDGETEFSNIYWGQEGIKLSIEIDKGDGYILLTDKEPLKSVPYAQTAAKIENEYFYTKSSDGSIRFSDPNNMFMKSYIKQTPESLEIGASPMLTGGIDSPYFKINSSAVWIKGELNVEETGDADMKPYIYGQVNSDGYTSLSCSSVEYNENGEIIKGFTSEKINSGWYKIRFINQDIQYFEYIVIATSDSSKINIGVTIRDGYFDVFCRDLDTYEYISSDFNFVVYKK